MWHSLDSVIKSNMLDPVKAKKLAVEKPDKYNMVDGRISTINTDSFVRDVKALSESFEVGDLKLVLEPKIHIDEFCSKIGKDSEIVVLSFLINDRQAAIDVVDFIEKGFYINV